MARRTQTICTIGPASENPEILEKLVLGGMDIARMNMSHATHEEFLNRCALIAEFNQKHNRNVKVMLDLKGPRMRVGELPEEGIKLEEGQRIEFTTDEKNKDAIYISDPYLHEDIQVNHPLFLVNGEMEVLITEKYGSEIVGVVKRGGTLFSRKAVNVPDTTLTTKGLTDKDVEDIKFGVKVGVDFIAMSFVNDGEDMKKLRELVDDPTIKLIPKIERKQALTNLDEIIEESDVIMVARGDLGIEIPLHELPLIQKYMIHRASMLTTPSIVATQMLLSMVDHARPTRAEVSDVANAVLDGAWGVMLSDETANGNYPVEALKYLVDIVERVEDFRRGALHFLG